MQKTPNTIAGILEAFEEAVEGGSTYHAALNAAKEAAANLPPEELKLARRMMHSEQTGLDSGHMVSKKPSLDAYDASTGSVAPGGIIAPRSPKTNSGGNMRVAAQKGTYYDRFPRWSAS